MTHTCGIYGIFDLDGTCLYVGQSRTIEPRWNRHIITLKAGNHKRAEFVEWFQSKDSDVSSMKFQVLEELISDCDESILNEREIHWFYELKPLFYGKVPSTKETWKHSEETRKKISAGMRKYFEASGRPLKKDMKLETTCLTCGTLITGKLRKVKYCSRKCYPGPHLDLTEEATNDLIEKSKTTSLRKLAPDYGVSHVALHNFLKRVQDNPP